MSSEYTFEDFCLDHYSEQAQPYIRLALTNPARLNCDELRKVAEEITYKACMINGYYKVVATACQRICDIEFEMESGDIIPSYEFRKAIISSCRNLFNDYDNMRDVGVQHWILFVRLVTKLYERIRPHGRGLTGLVELLFDCLLKLSVTPSVDNIAEIDLLCGVFHEVGSDLCQSNRHRMNEVMGRIRDAIIEPDTDSDTRNSLMELIELRAHGWKLSERAVQYYYGKG
ncbi:MIF4G domain-containing protein A-like [Tubulanus polymorphus]|uniref:MIF4G domain-containing protein A-like n=1 Tax=Tubulanus polymorphus TaxID=672921 RepID=UPI003DA2C571